jgi:hypothetical protein
MALGILLMTSFLFLSLAIYETFTHQRLFLIGLLLGASYWTRLNTILSIPFFIVMLSDKWLLESGKDSILKRVNLKPLIQLGFGVGILLITTPAVVYSIFAGIRNKLSLACWLGIFPVALLLFLKGGTGWPQFGYRYVMDFLPFLLLLIFKGIGNEIKWDHKMFICLGILWNLWGVIFINKFSWFEWW